MGGKVFITDGHRHYTEIEFLRQPIELERADGSGTVQGVYETQNIRRIILG